MVLVLIFHGRMLTPVVVIILHTNLVYCWLTVCGVDISWTCDDICCLYHLTYKPGASFINSLYLLNGFGVNILRTLGLLVLFYQHGTSLIKSLHLLKCFGVYISLNLLLLVLFYQPGTSLIKSLYLLKGFGVDISLTLWLLVLFYQPGTSLIKSLNL